MRNNLQKYDLPSRHDTTMTSRIRTICALAPTFMLAAALASCGGGGGGTNATPTPALTYQGTVTSVLAVTYTAEDLSISDEITAASSPSIRLDAGAGLLAQNPKLDTAASSHAAFLVDNNLQSNAIYLTTSFGGILGGHYEDNNTANASNQTNYTGASPQARATAAGYSGTVTELMTFGAADGAACVASLEDSVYHSIALVSPFIDMGIGFNAGGGGSVCAIVMGVKSTSLGQLPAAGPVVYPYDGQADVLPTFYNQAEVPTPPVTTSPAGHPVVVSLYTLATPTLSGSNIVIDNFSITPQSGVSALAQVLTKSGVTSGSGGPTLTPDSNIPAAGFVVLVPTSPLTPGTIYDISFSAKVKGQTVSKSWSFTTGAAN
ncbi:MAG: hypothetical protein WCA64_08510 [Gallionella sp.]